MIASDNQAYCWGEGTSGQLGNNTNIKSLVPVAVYTSGILLGKTVLKISANLYHTCAIASDNQAYCWGAGSWGQLGNGLDTESLVPAAATNSGVLAGMSLTSINGGYYVSCALDTRGSLYCWGRADSGNLGNGSLGYVSSPIDTDWAVLLQGKTILSMSSGYAHTCVLASDNKAYCWGSGWSGQLGNNSTASSPTPVAVDTSGVLAGKSILSVSAGSFHTCVVASDNKAYCWGGNNYGQLGNNSTVQSSTPVQVDMTGVLVGKTITSITAFTDHTCVVASDGEPYCWGRNNNGKLGNNSTANSLVPVAVDTSGVLAGKIVTSVVASRYHTCALTSIGGVVCWGYNADGELGNNSTANSLVPVAVDTSGVLSGKTVTTITTGYAHTCAIASDNKAYCWGSNWNGQLGNNSTSQSSVPVAVDTSGILAGKTINSIVAGDDHTCAIASDNKAYCWGSGYMGRLGNNSTSNSLVPVAVDTSGVLAGKSLGIIEAGHIATCVVSTDNQRYCWGSNEDSVLGNSQSQYAYYALTPNYVNLSTIPGSYILPSDNTFKLQFATRSTSTCSAQTTGFADVTASTAIAYNTASPVTNGSAITSNANDPVPPANSSPQTFISQPGTFTNTNIIQSGTMGIWDFALKDNAPASPNTTYCFRITYGDGTPLEAGATQYPEVTTADGVLTLGFVDSSGAPITQPTFGFNGVPQTTMTTQTSTGTFSDSTHKLRVFNSQATNGWSVSLAATGGNTAVWKRSDNLAQYAFNSNSGGGQLSVNPGAGSIASACSTSGTSLGSSANFVQGSQDNITLFTASSGAAMGCNWDFTGASLTQTIPAAQAAGSYTIDMTATVVAL